MTLLLLVIMISSSLTIPTSKKVLESNYRSTNKISCSFISKAEKEQNNNLLELLDNLTEFEGVQILTLIMFNLCFLLNLLTVEAYR
ncbi:hypothetical protein Hanom_Chr15g01348231 [Helianthus anomalus]